MLTFVAICRNLSSTIVLDNGPNGKSLEDKCGNPVLNTFCSPKSSYAHNSEK